MNALATSSEADPGKSHKHGFFSKFRHGD